MKFAVTGVHCTGKTTLVNALEESGAYYNRYKFITNQTRGLKGKVTINEGANDITQRAVLDVTTSTAMIDNSIDDRCILDTLAYTLGLYRRKQVTERLVLEAVNAFNKFIPRYDALFYLPAEFPLVDDGVRSVDTEWRNDLIGIFERLLNIVPVPVHIVNGDVETRVSQVNVSIARYEMIDYVESGKLK